LGSHERIFELPVDAWRKRSFRKDVIGDRSMEHKMKQRCTGSCKGFLAALIVCGGAFGLGAPAASARVKGQWMITITPRGTASLSTTMLFQRGGIGVGGNELSGGPLAYQETDTDLKVSWEFAGPLFPALIFRGPATILLRGTKQGKDLIMGTVIIVTNLPDSDSPIGYATKTGTFIATKQ